MSVKWKATIRSTAIGYPRCAMSRPSAGRLSGSPARPCGPDTDKSKGKGAEEYAVRELGICPEEEASVIVAVEPR